MEDVLRGLSLLGPTLSDLSNRLGVVEGRLAALSTAAKADHDSLEEVCAGFKTLNASSPTFEEFNNMKEIVANVSRESVDSNQLQELERKMAEALTSSSQQLAAVTSSVAKDMEKLGLLESALLSHQDDVMLKHLLAVKDLLLSKADRGSVPCLEDFDCKGILLKSNRTEVPTFDQVPSLLQTQFDDVDSKFKKLENSILSNVDELRGTVAGKAEISEVPSREEIQEIQLDIAQRARVSDMPDIAPLEGRLTTKADISAMSALTAKVDHKADLKWTQDSIRSLSDILLPVARAVRGLPAAAAGAGSDA